MVGRAASAGTAVNELDSNLTVAVLGAVRAATKPALGEAFVDLTGAEVELVPLAWVDIPAVAIKPVETARAALDRPTRASRPVRASPTFERGVAALCWARWRAKS
jgi:hypothetical protein